MRTRNTSWKWVGLLFVLGTALGVQAAPPSSKIPGYKPNEPWGAFLGRSAHFVIGRQYGLEHPDDDVFLNTIELFDIMREGKLGDPKRLSEFVRRLRPDITNASLRVLFEIKPDNEEGLAQAREQAGLYLAALNAAVEPDKKLSGGTGFEGSLFIEFERGGIFWQLSWRTPEPGVTLYRWSKLPKKAQASFKERAAQKQEALSREEAERHGALAEQAIRAAYGQGDWPKDFLGQVYRPVDCR